METDLKDLSIRYSQNVLTQRMMLGFLLAPAIVFFVYIASVSQTKSLVQLGGMLFGLPIAGILFAIGVGATRSYFGDRTALRLTAEGITYKPMLGKPETVAWADFQSVALVGASPTAAFVFDGRGSVELFRIPTADFERASSYVERTVGEYAAGYGAANAPASAPTNGTAPPRYRGPLPIMLAVTIPLFMLSLGGTAFVLVRGGSDSVLQLNSRSLVDTSLERSPMFQAIKKVDPESATEIRNTLGAGGLPNPEDDVRQSVSDLCNAALKKRLMQATPQTLKEYVELRLRWYSWIGSGSKEDLYDALKTGHFDRSMLPEAHRILYDNFSEQLDNDMASVILAPIASQPLARDDARAERDVTQIRSKLTAAEMDVLAKYGKQPVDHAAYCDAYLHFYKEGLTLPAEDAALVFRYVGEVPEDDRIGQRN